MENKIGFWGITDTYGCFSNFYPCKFKCFNDLEFNCTEQAFMYAKAITFNDIEIANKILAESDPKKIKALGRQVKNFNDDIWNDLRFMYMRLVNYSKFSQNIELLNKLVSTGSAYLFEASPYDSIWGIGKFGDGQNLLGQVLMQIREDFILMRKK